MIDAGLLNAGEVLMSEPRKGERYTATLSADGSIMYNGKSYSPSRWASEVAGNSRNGWRDVYAREKPLVDFREQLNNAMVSPTDTSDDNAVSVKSEGESEPEAQVSNQRAEIEVQSDKVEVVSPPEMNGLGSELESLKSRVSDQQSEIEILNTRIEYLTIESPPEVNGLQSELEGLKSQVSDQQSEIENLNAQVENLPAASPESDAENDIIRYLRERVLRLEPDEFERLVGEYLKSKGFSNVVVSGRSGDGGIDGECGIPFINVKVAFQAKRYTSANNIGIEPVQRLQGSMTGRYDRGVFITTSDYTSAAMGWVEEVQAQITLINGDELMKEMVDLGLGVKAVTVVKHELDEGFFADLENS